MRFGISRRTGYKWLKRYRDGGAAGPEELSRARRTQTLSIDLATLELILALREKRPGWGPRKLLARLVMDHSGQDWPAASTVGDLLRREGKSLRRRRVAREPGAICPKYVALDARLHQMARRSIVSVRSPARRNCRSGEAR